MQNRTKWSAVIALFVALAAQIQAAEIFPFQSGNWRYVIARQEVSVPADAWHGVEFDDSSWMTGPAPIGYANPANDPGGLEATIATTLPFSSTSPTWTSVYFRKTFSVANAAEIERLDLTIRIDDGFVAWVNGVEIGRFNVPAGNLAYSAIASSQGEVSEQVVSISNSGFLVDGTNVIAIHGLNGATGSSDFLVDASLTAQLDEAPAVLSIDPPPSGTVLSLTFVNVVFTENVTGVDAGDLLINSVPAANVVQNNPRDYTFQFPEPPTGAVTVAWAANPGIADIDGSPNAFVPGPSWSYTLDPNAIPSAVIISEFLAGNANGIEDDDGSRSDWIELYNPGLVDVNLNGWRLTDNATNLTKWTIPSVVLGANKYLLIWASGNNRTNPAAPLHTNFKLSKDPDSYLALVTPDGMIASSFSGATYPQQQDDISYGRDRVDPDMIGYFVTPTPGAQNAMSGSGFAPEPTLSLESGVYTNASLSLVITVPANTTVRYTMDGSIPTNTSPAYTAPITLMNNTTIKTRAFPLTAGLFPSAVLVRNFVFLDATTMDFDSNIPILVISTEGRSIGTQPPGVPRTPGTFVLYDTFRGRSSLQRKPDYIGPAGFEIVGQTSAGFAKRPYRIELHDALGNDKDVSLLGMPAEADWQLRNPFSDKCMMNDFLGYELFEQMGHYSCRRRFVEVFTDSGGGRLSYPGDYVGIEVLFERIERGKDRVDIAELTPANTTEPSITGGYIFKKDKDSTGDLNFVAGGGQALKMHEPKPNSLRVQQGVTTTWPSSGGFTPSGSNQMSYLVSYLNAFNAAMTASDWLTRTGTNHYSYYIDVDAFVDQHWIVEFTKQIDGYRLSDFFTKDRNGKVKPEPIWDWNLSFGNADYLQGGITNTWYYTQASASDHIWLRRLLGGASLPNSGGDPDFIQKVIDRWGDLRTNVLKGKRVLARIDEIANLLTDNDAAASPITRNFTKYPNLNTYLWPNPDGPPDQIDYTQPTYALIISEMKKWTIGRYTWIDSLLPKAPSFSLPEGDITSGSPLEIVAPAGTVYYTLDGTDPRALQANGAVAPGALTYSGIVTLTDNARVFARARVGTTWSPPTIATYVVDRPRLIISEIMYHPLPPAGPSPYTDEDFEYLELKNVGSTSLNLAGYTISGGVDFTFPARTLAAGARVLVVNTQAAFLARYPGLASSIAGEYTGNLANDGERLVLRGHLREPILDFSYDDDWYPITDGFGFSLVVVDENAPASAWGTRDQWRPSGDLNGTPGQGDGAAPTFPQVVINEALTHSDPPPPTDTIELHNLDAAPADISGWYLTDDFRTPKKYRIPNQTVIAPNGYVTFDESQFNTNTMALMTFSLSSHGDEVYLFAADVDGNLTGYFHGFEFGAAKTGVTFGRYVNSVGDEHFVSLTSATLGSANAGLQIGPVVITEIMYRPPDVLANGAYWNNSEDEFIELRNISGATVNLYDPAYPANQWRLDKAVEFTFPTNTSMPAGSYLLVVNFNPLDAAQLSAFRSKYGVSPAIPIYGPYSGGLDNAGEDLGLYMPDTPEPIGPDAGTVPYVLVDRVRYSDKDPWPQAADGMGHSLQRISQNAYGDDPMNWAAATATPGAAFVGGSLPTITQNPSDRTVVGGTSATFSGLATGVGPIRYQWRANGVLIDGATNSVLTVENVQLSQAGQYVLYALNPFGAAMSAPATLTVLVPLEIDSPPSSQAVAEGSNVTFSVVALSTKPPISFQWRFNGALIPNATNANYFIASVTEFDDGIYDVLCTDGNGTLPSPSATLTVLIPPTLVSPNPPLNLTAVEGETVTLSARTRGTKPIWTIWRRFDWPVGTGGNIIRSGLVDGNTDFLIMTNVGANVQGRYSMLMTNIAGGRLNIQQTNAFLTVLMDSDGDGLPDIWESAHGLNPANASDALIDSDGDTMSNHDEYIAGTDPKDATSYLKVAHIAATGAATIEFLAVSNRTYSVLFKDSVSDLNWSALTDVIAQSVNHLEQVVDPNPASGRIYRLVTPKQP